MTIFLLFHSSMTQFINYRHSLPIESISLDHPDNIKNLPVGYPFDELDGCSKPQLIDVLKKYVTGELPNSSPPGAKKYI